MYLQVYLQGFLKAWGLTTIQHSLSYYLWFNLVY